MDYFELNSDRKWEPVECFQDGVMWSDGGAAENKS